MVNFIYVYRPVDRSDEDIDLVYEELLNMRALRHLSNAVSWCYNLRIKIPDLKLSPHFCICR